MARKIGCAFVLLAFAALALFGVQNWSRTTDLSFDLGIAAWHLQPPLPVPELMLFSLAAGFVFALLVRGLWSRGKNPPSAATTGVGSTYASDVDADDDWA
jgi:hypothetical protein